MGMVFNFYLAKPPKRKIPKNRVARSHHYVMIYPTDFTTNEKQQGMPYTNFWDSFLEDCVERMYKYAPELFDYDENSVMTCCLN